MKAAQFENFLRNVKGLGEGTISSRLSNCRRLEEYEGDLDQHVDQGGIEQLLDRLAYSTEDQRRDAPQRHRVPINGDVRTGTATLRNAALLYLEFRQDPTAPTHGQIRGARRAKPATARSSRVPRSTRRWPKWEQASDADILQLAHVLTPLVRFLHPDIVAAVVKDNRERMSDWRTKFDQIGIKPDIYLWDGSPCAFPGIRRYAGSQEVAWYRKRTASTNFTPQNCLRLDDNDYPKHLWAFVLTGGPFRKKGPDGYQLAHLADHKEHNNRWRDEFDLDSSFDRTEPLPLFGLYTSPANAAYVPKNFLHPTDVVYPLRALLLRRAFSLYGGICRLAPPPLAEKPLADASWNPDGFDWSDPVGDLGNVREFLEYRKDQVNRAFDTRLANVRVQPQGNEMPPAKILEHAKDQEPVRGLTKVDVHEGVKHRRYPDYAPPAEAHTQAAASSASAEWEAAIELAAAELREAMEQWAASGLPAPQVGYPLADNAGKVLAEGELAWPDRKVALLHGEEAGRTGRTAFESAGWRVYSAVEDDEFVERVAARLSRSFDSPQRPL